MDGIEKFLKEHEDDKPGRVISRCKFNRMVLWIMFKIKVKAFISNLF